MITTNLLTAPAVCDDGPAYTASGMQIPADEVHARRIAREAEAWLTFASERSRMRPDTVVRKALDAAAFSVARRAASFAVPTKLAGVVDCQRALWRIVHDRVAPWSPLEVHDTGAGLAVSYGDDRLGEIQPKHVAWARPLVPFGMKVYLARVTGHEREGYRLTAPARGRPPGRPTPGPAAADRRHNPCEGEYPARTHGPGPGPARTGQPARSAPPARRG